MHEYEEKDGDENEQENDEIIKIKEMILNYDPKFKFGSSLDSITAHTFLSFIDIN